MIENVTPERCIEFAIQTEEIGARMYKDLAARFASDRELSELFAGLALEELDHGDRFRALHGRLAAHLRPASTEQQDYLRAMSMSEVFDAQALSKSVSGIRSRDDALERALALEKATLAYYQAMREIIGPDEFLEVLISVEKKHVVKVMQLLLTGAKFRGLADTF
jgi:rubrerythrin